MADLSRLKKGRLGTPPPIEEAAISLTAPETAPGFVPNSPEELIKSERNTVTTASPYLTHPSGKKEQQMEIPYVRIDGRSARKTNRTIAFATRVTPAFDKEVREIAVKEGLLIVEVLEQALEALRLQKNPAS